MESNLTYIPGGRLNHSGMLGDGYAGSAAQYINELSSIERRLSEIEVQIANPNIEESTREAMRNEKIGLLARKSAIQQWLTLSTEQKNKTNPLTWLQKKTNSYLKSLNKLKNEYEKDGESIYDMINMDVAGLPLWGVLLLAGAAVYFIWGKK